MTLIGAGEIRDLSRDFVDLPVSSGIR
jgi:hypothetical protein